MAAESTDTQSEGSDVDLVYNRLQTEASSMAYHCVVRMKEDVEQPAPLNLVMIPTDDSITLGALGDLAARRSGYETFQAPTEAYDCPTRPTYVSSNCQRSVNYWRTKGIKVLR